MNEPDKCREITEEEGYKSPKSVNDFIKHLFEAEIERREKEELSKLQSQIIASIIEKRVRTPYAVKLPDIKGE